MENEYILNSLSGAMFSDDRVYRYTLWRRWVGWRQPDAKLCVFIGLNPSTADEREDDPTIRRCINYAKAWGYDGLVMLNLFAFRATDPVVLKAAPDPVGPENDRVIYQVCQEAPRIVACWGDHGVYKSRDVMVPFLLRDTLRKLYCFGRTRSRQPRHPLYLRKTRELELLIK